MSAADEQGLPHDGHGHDEHDEHGHDGHGHDHPHGGESHSAVPLAGVDPVPLHAAVDALAAALHSYVETAVGVRAEFGSAEADEDPRVLALESRVGMLNAALYDALHDGLGLHADLTGMAWDDEDDDHDADAPPATPDVETFHLGFVVHAATGDRTFDSALDLVDAGGSRIADELAEAGFVVDEWGTARGGPVGFADDEDDDEDEGDDR